MEELVKKIKKHLEELSNKKFINNVFIILIVAVIALAGLSYFTKEEKQVVEKPMVMENSTVETNYTTNLENRLSQILEKLEGVGKVDVMITLEESVESIPAVNTSKTVETTKEIDGEGGTREVNREDVDIQILSSDSTGNILLLKEINPTVRGVIVAAEGAEDLAVMEKIYEAVKTVLGVTGNKVQVYSSK